MPESGAHFDSSVEADQELIIKLKGSDLVKFQNLDWSSQHIGFQNWMDLIGAHAMSLEVENSELKLIIAKLSKAPKSELDQLEGICLDNKKMLDKLVNAEMQKVE